MQFIKSIFSSSTSSRKSTKKTGSPCAQKIDQSNAKKCARLGQEIHSSLLESQQLAQQPLNMLSEKFKDCSWGTRYDETKKTLIFDLDNTLILACKDVPENGKYAQIILEKDDQLVVRYIVKRPGLLKFLKKLSKKFNICIYTSAEETYAKKVIEATSISKYIYTFYDRAHCNKVGNCSFVKDIWALGFKDTQAVLIDDIAFQIENQPNNGINIKAFEGQECDRELYKLYPFLKKLQGIEDVRPVQKHLNDHVNGGFKVCRKYSDEYEPDVDEGCHQNEVKPSCCPESMLNRRSLESCFSTSTHSHSDSESLITIPFSDLY
eukprot:CAMPEP_0176466760 /NCGR_PEP_ID=MMETSP0127-20121128/38085_1 /TAXON_ID=938130 /ORGANISM="Platyophrya macrostoma, Strain WH" /LENGTH=320 /DNA_ID=CAMNT_0017859991 /DNA_START=27 /DNA_END=989 /DNA_ORIENTATION=+